MQKFVRHQGLVVPLNRENVDTDQIIPKQFLKSIKRTGFGQNLFDEWRYLDEGQPGRDCSNRPLNTGFILNQPRYQGASILLAQKNFGCGSSREHAPWAILEYGIRCVIAPSYADIFFSNSFKNGLLLIVLDQKDIDDLFMVAESDQGCTLDIDLESQKIVSAVGKEYSFEVDSFRRHCLLNGLDDIGISLEDSSLIRNYEEKRRETKPWLFDNLHSK